MNFFTYAIMYNISIHSIFKAKPLASCIEEKKANICDLYILLWKNFDQILSK